jgi:hypothetical protein
VADRDVRDGAVGEARSGYKSVRDSKDLASYAQYRLAGLLAADGEADRARQMLQLLADDRSPGPFTAMLRDAARSALANHQATDRGLVQVIPWIDEICPPGDVACRRELRAAAADTWRRAGDVRSEAWLRTVDAADPLEGNPGVRLDLARNMVSGLPAFDLVMAAEAACSGPDGREVRPGCRAEMALAVGNFHDQAGDPTGSWIQGYARLPRLDRPDVQREVANLVRQPGPPDRELAALDALCKPNEPACTARLHTHLRAVWSRLDRVHDAAWLHFVDSPPPWPGIDEAVAQGLVRMRAPARTVLGSVDPACTREPTCAQDIHPLMVGYYAAIGEEAEAAWLIALQGIDELPLSEAGRLALRDAAMRGLGGAEMARAVIRTCPAYTAPCFATSRVAAEAFLRAAQRVPEANEAAKFGVLSDFRIVEPAWTPLIEVLVGDLDARTALAKVTSACGSDPSCGIEARAALAAWYAEMGRPDQERMVLAVDRTVELGAWEPVRDRLLRVLYTAPDEATARARIPDLCPVGSADCQAVLGEAVRAWYQGGTAP